MDPASALLVDAFGHLHSSFIEPPQLARSETLRCWERSGALQVLRPAALRSVGMWGSGRCLALPLPEEHSVDINTELDWQFVEFLLSQQQQPQQRRRQRQQPSGGRRIGATGVEQR